MMDGTEQAVGRAVRVDQSAARLVAAVIGELESSLRLIDAVGDEAYAAAGGVGAHIRHDLDFVTQLIAGVVEGKIDYGMRTRDPRIETDRAYASEKITAAIGKLKGLISLPASRQLLVRSEADEDLWLRSSLGRELEFLYSHTVHHHALIAAKLRADGIEPPAELGVARSTLEYWKSRPEQGE